MNGLNGHTSRCATQKSYAIDLGDGLPDAQASLVQPWHGLKVVLLKKHPYDLSRIRNTLSSYLFRSIPNMVSRPTWLVHATFIDPTSNSADPTDYLNTACSMPDPTTQTADCRLFENVEEEEDDWQTVHGMDPKGQFWKAESFTFAPVAAVSGLRCVPGCHRSTRVWLRPDRPDGHAE
jgi:spore coat protein H